MSKFEESKFYKLLQDFFINNDKETFLQMLSEFYNRTEGIINKNGIQDDLIKELRELYLEFNEKGIDENIVIEKVNYFVENNVKIKDILAKLVINTNKIEDNTEKLNENTNSIENINSQMETIKTHITGYVNVKSFKCDDGKYVVGDGIHDDTSGIQRFINYVTTHKDKGIISPGKYKITNTLKIPPCHGCEISGVGNGFQSCMIIQETNNIPILEFIDGDLQGFVLSGLCLVLHNVTLYLPLNFVTI